MLVISLFYYVDVQVKHKITHKAKNIVKWFSYVQFKNFIEGRLFCINLNNVTQ